MTKKTRRSKALDPRLTFLTFLFIKRDSRIPSDSVGVNSIFFENLAFLSKIQD